MEEQKLLKKCAKMFDELQYAYDLCDHTDSVERLCKKIRKITEPVKSENKKAKKTSKRKSWKDELIAAWKPLFDEYPELQAIPVYAWGRYYKYECSGDPFESFVDESGLEGLISHEIDYEFNEELISKIDKKHENWDSYYPDRNTVKKAYDFDERGGMCLVIEKINNKLELNAYSCGSPE